MTTVNKSNTTLNSLINGYLSESDIEVINRAFRFAEKCHKGQFRKTGDPYIVHPINTAIYLANMRIDSQTISAALMHDVIEDCGVTYGEIEDLFGKEVAGLVDGVTKLPTLKISSKDNLSSGSQIARAATIRKLLVATSEDARVILIKLADRLHNMQTLHALDKESI